MVQFIDLWRGHPTNESVDAPCTVSERSAYAPDEAPVDAIPSPKPAEAHVTPVAPRDQSAIRLGVAMRRAGVRIEELGPRLQTCGIHDRSLMHILSASQFAAALRRAKIAGFGDVELIAGSDVERFEARIIGRTGVLYVRDYWMRPGDAEGRPTGDLIDLWNGYRTTDSWLMEWMSWAGYTSAYGLAREMWFWPVA
ncbi:MAG: T6SS effector amidase Tae4 family protein [Hyphomicrobium sp.]